MELVLSQLTKRYRGKTAVDRFSARFQSGVYGLLRANGSGKTTLMRMLAGVLEPTSGNISLDGVPIRSLGERYRAALGYLPQSFGVYPRFTAMEFMRYLAAAKGMEKPAAEEAARRLLALVGLEREGGQRVKTFSGGMKQRLGIAQALLNDPAILILDEPTAGLDPRERIRLRNLLGEISADRLVLLSTHIVSDLENTAEQILMVKNGTLLKQGTPEELAALAGGRVWILTVPQEEAQGYQGRFAVSSLRRLQGGRVELRLQAEQRPAPGAAPAEPTLEDAYLSCFGGEIAWEG
ncbi:MAG: ABC transporter ATP-binding protein [Oscillospiraceae bacterium]|nr:ABC transporter ATP-binding protein [Oscillospiraceae bacterium]